MPAEQIAASLAYINWTVLTGLAVGSFGAVVLGLLRTSATKGYLGFVALTSAAFGFLAWLSDGGAGGWPAVWSLGSDRPWRTCGRQLGRWRSVSSPSSPS